MFAAALTLGAPGLAAPAPAKPASAPADPQKAALAGRVAMALWPDGTYGRILDSMFGGGGNGLADLFLDMRPGEVLGMMAESMAGNGKAAAPSEKPAAPSPTLREALRAEDPYFEERMRITMKVIGEEVNRIARPLEPRFRDGLAKSIARRFTTEQLGPIAAFLETEAGKAYAAQSMTLFIDKDVMLAMIQSMPAIIKEMPTALKKVEQATAHLPKPKPKAEPVDEDDDEKNSTS